MKTLIYNISELVTLGPLVREHRFTSLDFQDLGVLQNAWLLIEDGKVLDRGSNALPSQRNCIVINAQNCLVMPGLIDSHTHPVFAGSRAHEFCKRLEGKSYLEIAQEGGGIAFSVSETRKGTLESLGTEASKNLKSMLSYGVTTVEAKSGYGLTVESELLQLRALDFVRKLTPQTIISTCLALHALPKEALSGEQFASEMAALLLPQIAKEKLANFVDAFVEKDYFTPEQAKIWFLEAKKWGLGIKLHADEFTDSGGADLAATLGATSADHLQFASEDGLRRMAKSQVVATLLPGTSLYTGIPFTNGKRIADLGCPLAIASDFNPGSSPFVNLPFLASMAGVHNKLTPAQIIAGVTFVPAKSLGVESHAGALEPGYQADFFLHPCQSVSEWIADMGKTKPRSIFVKGIEVQLLT